jgi:lipoyl(octanoyl) transferase
MKSEEQRTVQWCDLGRTRYAPVWDLQRRLHAAVASEAVSDTVLLTEHEHVYTLGKSGDVNHLLADRAELERSGVDFFEIDRGGDITYHGPGQIVCYPILNLERYQKDIHWYLRQLEEVIIRTLRHAGVQADRSAGETGVWVANEKIAAIGIKVNRWTTMHGFALNVTTDLRFFGRIIPCGIFHKGVTSLAECTGRDMKIQDITAVLRKEFESVFGTALKNVDLPAIESRLSLPPIQNAVYVNASK